MSDVLDIDEEEASAAPVFRVMPENVTALWPQLEALFVPALALVSTHKAEDVRRAIIAGRAQLWAQISGSLVIAAATTEFIDYPVGLYVRVWLAGARPDMRLDNEAFFEALNRWRETNRCVGFEAIGRHGWLRKYPARVEGLVMRWAP